MIEESIPMVATKTPKKKLIMAVDPADPSGSVAVYPIPRRELTPGELREREAAKVRMGKSSVNADPDIDTLVMNPANPYLSLYREFKAGLLTLAELEDAIDAKICSDEKELKGFELLCLPAKPDELIEAEEKIRSKNKPDEWDSLISGLHVKIMEEGTKRKAAAHLRTCELIKTRNRSNLLWLKDMHKRQRDRNQVYAGRILAAISTHEAV